MPRGQYDRSLITRATEYEHNRDPDYVAWRAQRLRENCASRAGRHGADREHQKTALPAATAEAISETIARMRAEIVGELKAERSGK